MGRVYQYVNPGENLMDNCYHKIDFYVFYFKTYFLPKLFKQELRYQARKSGACSQGVDREALIKI